MSKLLIVHSMIIALIFILLWIINGRVDALEKENFSAGVYKLHDSYCKKNKNLCKTFK